MKENELVISMVAILDIKMAAMSVSRLLTVRIIWNLRPKTPEFT